MYQYKNFSEARRQKKLVLQARAKRLYEEGYSTREIARKIGMSNGWVGEVVKVANKNAVDSEKTELSTITEMSKTGQKNK